MWIFIGKIIYCSTNAYGMHKFPDIYSVVQRLLYQVKIANAHMESIWQTWFQVCKFAYQ